MNSSALPTTSDLQKLAALASRPESRAYFFDRLENPAWVEPLSAAGYFAHPPSPELDESRGGLRFDPWPEGSYLARMAPLTPEAVLEVIDGLEVSENPSVVELVLQAALALPEGEFRQLSSRLPEWLKAPFLEYYVDTAAEIVNRLFSTEFIDLGLESLEALLEPQPDPRLASKADQQSSLLRLLEPVARVPAWDCRRLIESVFDGVVESAGIAAVFLFADLLTAAERLGEWTVDDSFHHRRSAIEDHGQNGVSDDVSDTLIEALRDVSIRVSADSDEAVGEVVERLEAGSTLLRRTALHVLASSATGQALVSERIGDLSLFDDSRLHHEHSSLIRQRWQDASNDAQEAVLARIVEGPAVDGFRSRYAAVEGVEPDAEAVRRYVGQWQRDRYSIIGDKLEGESAEVYRRLVSEFGPAEHPDFLSWSSTWSGPESPSSVEELSARSPIDVIAHLRSWLPEDGSGWHFGPSIEGLGRALEQVVSSDPVAYAALSAEFTDLDPTYGRSLLSGLRHAVKQGDRFEWSQVLALMSHIADQPFEPDEEVPDRDRDPGWRWARREVSSLIEDGLRESEAAIEFEQRTTVWNVLSRLSVDPNPSPSHEQLYGGSNMGPFTLSLNTNRGEALHAVVRYALWCMRELQNRGGDYIGFDSLPEVRELLDRHLDPAYERSAAVRAVYGRWLPWLLLLDEAWTVAHLVEIFSRDSDSNALDELGAAAWGTYLAFCRPFDAVLGAVRQEYERAIEAIPTEGVAVSPESERSEEKLGEHLVTYMWRGLDVGDLVSGFFERADDSTAAHVLAFVQGAVRRTKGDLEAGVAKRIEALGRARVEAIEVEPLKHSAEARALGGWYGSGKLSEETTRDLLRRSLPVGGSPDLGHLVVERLAHLAGEDPMDAAELLAALLEGQQRDWEYLSWRDHSRVIVAAALQSGRDDAVAAAKAIVDYHVKRGDLDFRKLLNAEP